MNKELKAEIRLLETSIKKVLECINAKFEFLEKRIENLENSKEKK